MKLIRVGNKGTEIPGIIDMEGNIRDLSNHISDFSGDNLSDTVVKSISDLDGWIFKNNTITKEYTFDKYMDSIDFINKIAIEAEELNHHPDINLGCCRVIVSFTSHDEGGVTKKCVTMAKNLENII